MAEQQTKNKNVFATAFRRELEREDLKAELAEGLIIPTTKAQDESSELSSQETTEAARPVELIEIINPPAKEYEKIDSIPGLGEKGKSAEAKNLMIVGMNISRTALNYLKQSTYAYTCQYGGQGNMSLLLNTWIKPIIEGKVNDKLLLDCLEELKDGMKNKDGKKVRGTTLKLEKEVVRKARIFATEQREVGLPIDTFYKVCEVAIRRQMYLDGVIK